MAKSKNQHVVPHKGGWAIKTPGSQKPGKVTPTQGEAINIARDRAKKQRSELFIHNKQGKIRERDSYGNDPFPPKG